MFSVSSCLSLSRLTHLYLHISILIVTKYQLIDLATKNLLSFIAQIDYPACCIHVSIFLLYIVLSYYVALELPSDSGEIDFERQIIGKIGIYISALAGLGLIRKPWSFLPLLEKGESDIDDELLSNDMSINDDSSALEATAEEIWK